MKLELKHLVGYLPYSLNILYWNGNAKEYIDILQVLHLETKNVLGSDKHKPILRPLSDLTKEIDYNGEKLVPIEWLLDNRDVEAEYDFISALEDDWASAEDKIIFAPFSIAQKLLEWHFDVFGLIEKDLAVNINTLSVPE